MMLQHYLAVRRVYDTWNLRTIRFSALIDPLRELYFGGKQPSGMTLEAIVVKLGLQKTNQAKQGPPGAEQNELIAEIFYLWETACTNFDPTTDSNDEVYLEFKDFAKITVPSEFRDLCRELPRGLQKASNRPSLETRLEPCCRLWNLMLITKESILVNETAAKTKKAFNFTSNSSVEMTRAMIPKWATIDSNIEQDDESSTMAYAARLGASGPEQPKARSYKDDVQCFVLFRKSDRWKRHEQQYVDADDIDCLTTGKEQAFHNPCRYRNWIMWKNDLRKKFQLFKRKADIKAASITLYDDQGAELEEEEILNDEEEDMIFDECFQFLQNQARAKAVFEVQLRYPVHEPYYEDPPPGSGTSLLVFDSEGDVIDANIVSAGKVSGSADLNAARHTTTAKPATVGDGPEGTPAAQISAAKVDRRVAAPGEQKNQAVSGNHPPFQR
ncbi:hypothetical protein DOTSEDRAFT_70232 [Dothistroma septosporum NZE10]|uniref:Uncharacterized protein n=1 Tax=Dothistroma septosporum (strain NZE10 / CBS 128990) TaxID=675120 RepID=N1PS17_DOTSN|nr:hypothetical protein DOTSEDRAFT_70232 [Dothistroma septosporum NZE10]